MRHSTSLAIHMFRATMIFVLALSSALAAQAATHTVNSTADTDDGACDTANCTLREAIHSAAQGDTIVFSLPGLPAVITLTSGELYINKSLRIQGPGAGSLVISGNNASRVFHVYTGSTVTLEGLAIVRGNSAGEGGGGGILNWGTLTVRRSAVSFNRANSIGGGIYSVGTLSVTDSTVSNNESGFGGGGIYGDSSVNITNSTISNNTADRGGGVEGAVRITNTTVTGNRARIRGGGINFRHPSVVVNTIVAGNFRRSGPDFVPDDVTVTGIADPSSSRHNLIGDAATAGYFVNGENGNIVGVNGSGTININTVLETTLLDNGGGTLTHKLVPGSPAIDRGSNALSVDVDNNPLSTDQRGAGFPRIARETVDIGAVEHTIIVTNTSDGGNGSLRGAIDSSTPGDTIVFNIPPSDPGCSGGVCTIVSSFSTDKELTILGPGADKLIVSGADQFGIFYNGAGLFGSGGVVLSGLTFANGKDTEFEFSQGAAIRNHGLLTLNDCVIRDNRASRGGAVFNSGALRINNSTISGNRATYRGGGILNYGYLALHNSTVHGNSAYTGGGIDNVGYPISFGRLYISNSTISGNSVVETGEGGGIRNGGLLKISNSTITLNAGVGGGIFLGGEIREGFETPTAELNNTIVAGNIRPMHAGISSDDISRGDPGSRVYPAANNLIGDAATSGGIEDGINVVGVNGFGTIPISTILDTSLADNGGPTLTHRLVSGSPAINRGLNDYAVDANDNPLTTDQRGPGFPRVFGDFVDIGAFEFQDPNNEIVKCPRTSGFWKTRPSTWPVAALYIGAHSYVQEELLNILNMRAGGDASLILAGQLIAAKLNAASGSDAPPTVSDAISDADALLAVYGGKLPYKVKPQSVTGQQMLNSSAVLESYNKGLLTTGCSP